MMAFVAILTIGMVSCGKDDNGNANGGNGSEQSITDSLPTPDPGQDTMQPGPQPQPTPEGWVDLGLPSGLLWAECNLGANTPEGYGDHFAWGEISPKDVYNWNTYLYCNENSPEQLTKYCYDASYGYNGFIDNLTTLEAMDDAASAILGNGARTPTDAEWRELLTNCSSTWTTQNGVKGRIFTGANGNTLFLPAAGFRHNSYLDGVSGRGLYWSSSLSMYDPPYARSIEFNSDARRMDGNSRSYGFSVRAVREN